MGSSGAGRRARREGYDTERPRVLRVARLAITLLAAALFVCPALAAPTARSIAERYGLDGVRAGARPWRPAELTALEVSLSSLTARERVAVAGVRFVRGGLARHPLESGLFTWDRRGRRIVLYGRAFRDGKPGPNWTIVHEVGHAIAAHPLVRAQAREKVAIDAYNRSVEAYNEEIGRYNALVRRFNRGDADRASVKRAQSAVDAARRRHEALRGPALEAKRGTQRVQRQLKARAPSEGVLAAYRKVLGSRSPPTAYGRRNVRESFSEALAMYRCDPARLKRLLPEVHAWFARGGHTQGL